MDYYKRLGVAKTASPDELKRAYKKLAMQHHPDRGGDQRKFQEINEAYNTLKDPAKRKDYDNPQPKNNYQYNSQNMNDMFNQFFRQSRVRRRNADISISLRVKLQDVATGKDVIGKYRLNSGQEEIANLRIPAGIESGMVIKMAGLGDDSIKSLPRGDLHVQVIVENHRDFVRDRSHIRTKCSINVLELILGTEVIIVGLTGNSINVKIPAGTNPGTILSLPGYGIPDIHTNKVGNLYLEIKGVTPKIEDKEILKEVENLNVRTSTSTRR